MEFEWDAANMRHVLFDRPHGVTPRLLRDLSRGAPELFVNPPRIGRSGTHLMIAPDADGRFWTIVLLHRRDTLWRPITGWPSTDSEIRRYRGEEQ